jgi:hypothetical protein
MLFDAYQQVKLLDPHRLIAVSFFGGSPTDVVRPYLAATDVCMVDIYPVQSTVPFGDDLSLFYSQLLAHRKNASAKLFWPILQACTGTYNNRLPDKDEERYMVYAAIQSGADGLFFWTHEYAAKVQPTWPTEVLAPLVTEVKRYALGFAHGELSGKVTASNLSTRATLYPRVSGSGFILLLINHGGKETDTQVSIDPSIVFTSLRENGMPVATQLFSSLVSLERYQARLFELL